MDIFNMPPVGEYGKPRKRRVATTGRQPDDPTPEEIRQACLEIQAGWNEVTRSGRKAPIRPVDMTTVHRVVGSDE